MNEMSPKVSKVKSAETSSILTNRSKRSKSSKVSIQEVLSQNDQIEVKDVGPHPLSSEYIVLRGKGAEKLLSAEKNLIVPQSSPRSDFIFDKNIDTIPRKINNITELKIPYVRVLGIKKTIDILGGFFGCTLYKTSLLQFWFLDMVTDCLWKCQDEFMLNEKYQIVVLGWILYFFDIIRDPLLNFSRGQLFRILRETLILAEERIECGDSYFPSPEELFALNLPVEPPEDFEALMSASTDSSLSFDDSGSDHSFLVMPSEEYSDLPEFYRLPPKECRCDISVTSSLETLSEKSIHIEKETQSHDDDFRSNSGTEENAPEISYSISDFYQPDSEIHSRFLDIKDQDDVESIISDQMECAESSDVEYEWVNESERIQPTAWEKPKSAATIISHDTVSVLSSMRKIRNSSTKPKTKPERKSTQEDSASLQTLTLKKSKVKVPKEDKKQTEKELLRAWLEFNLLEQRNEVKINKRKKSQPEPPFLDEITVSRFCFLISLLGSLPTPKETARIPENLYDFRKTQLKNAPWQDKGEILKEEMADPDKGWKPYEPELCSDECICGKIEYTPEDFENEEYIQIRKEWLQYLDKHKVSIDQTTQNVFVNSCLLLIIKQLIFEYFYESFQYKLVKMTFQTVPNLTYEKLNDKWFVPKQSKEEFRRPLEKKPKPPKPLKEKLFKSKEKKPKGKDEKKSKSSKGSVKKEKLPKLKPDKPHKLTKEEKEESERVKREEEQRVKEEVAAEENRRFIFALGLAANEEFFRNIFEDYVSPDERKGKDKKNKQSK